jgi:adenosine/AMP kinase
MEDAIKNLKEELAIIDAKLTYLLKRGGNDESLVNDKRELQMQIAILKGEKYVHVRQYS